MFWLGILRQLPARRPGPHRPSRSHSSGPPPFRPPSKVLIVPLGDRG